MKMAELSKRNKLDLRQRRQGRRKDLYQTLAGKSLPSQKRIKMAKTLT